MTAQTMRRWAGAAIALVPAYVVATTLLAIVLAFQPAPYQDQWSLVAAYREFLRDGASFDWFWRQHNEHRIVFPRLVFLADLAWARGSNLLNLAAILAIQVSGALLFARLALSGRRSILTAAALAIAVTALFSLTQWENLVWGFQVQFVGVYACGGWGLFLFCRAVGEDDRIDWASWAGAMALLTVCTFSMANGVLAGGAMLALAIAARFPARLLLATLGGAAVLAAAYFHGYHMVEGHSSPTLALTHPAAFAHYVLAYLGALFGMPHQAFALGYGMVGAALTALMAAEIVRRRERDVAQLALFGVVLFIGLSAAATALGRLGFGYQQAISSRYVTPSAYFWAALLVYWSRRTTMGERRGLKVAAAGALAVAAAVLVRIQTPMSLVVADWSEHVARGADGLLLGVEDAEASARLFPDRPRLMDWDGFLRAQRLSFYGGPEAGWIGRRVDRVFASAPPQACLGAFDELNPAPGGPAAGWRAKGWAWDRRSHLPARRIVLASGEGDIVGLGARGAPRPDVRRAVPEVWLMKSGWTGVARAAPPGPVRAYAVLWDGRACPIGERPAP